MKDTGRLYLVSSVRDGFESVAAIDAYLKEKQLDPGGFLAIRGTPQRLAAPLQLLPLDGTPDATAPKREKPDVFEAADIDAAILDALTRSAKPITAREAGIKADRDWLDVSPSLQRLRVAGRVVKVTGKTWQAVKPVVAGGAA